MFAGATRYALELPVSRGTDRCTCFRALHLLAGDGWYIVDIATPDVSPQPLNRMVFAWDTDLADLLEGPSQARIHQLTFVEPPKAPGSRWQCRSIARVWRGRDASCDGFEVLIFETEEGDAFCGLDAVPLPQSVGDLRLVATIAAAARRSRRSLS